MSFCTVLNCIDGRVQLPVLLFLQKRFNVPYVDTVTEPGVNLVLAEEGDEQMIEILCKRVQLSVEMHNSVGIAVVGHHDCAGNPEPYEEQRAHTEKAINFLKTRFADLPLVGLWVDENWQVHEIT